MTVTKACSPPDSRLGHDVFPTVAPKVDGQDSTRKVIPNFNQWINPGFSRTSGVCSSGAKKWGVLLMEHRECRCLDGATLFDSLTQCDGVGSPLGNIFGVEWMLDSQRLVLKESSQTRDELARLGVV